MFGGLTEKLRFNGTKYLDEPLRCVSLGLARPRPPANE